MHQHAGQIAAALLAVVHPMGLKRMAWMPVGRAATDPREVLRTEKARTHPVRDGQPVRVPTVLEATGGGQFGVGRGTHHVAGRIEVTRQRLLAQHGLIRRQCGDRHLVVQHGRSCDRDDIEVVAGDERLPIGGGLFDAQLAGHAFQPLGCAGTQRDGLEALRRPETGHLHVRTPSHADDADP